METKNRVYISARHGRREEMKGYAEALRGLGYIVTSRWLDVKHDGDDDYTSDLSLKRKWAKGDLDDVFVSDIVIAFTETEEEVYGVNRGGRHWEACAGYLQGEILIVVGPIENIFHALAHEQYGSWELCYEAMERRMAHGLMVPAAEALAG